MGFGFRVVHAFSCRCFTLTVRPCVALALPMTCGTAFFYFVAYVSFGIIHPTKQMRFSL